jgi:hypothetical protein
MPNKVYEVYDNETKKTYTIEGPEGATPEEFGSFIAGQSEQPAPQASVDIGQGHSTVPTQPSKPSTPVQDVSTEIKFGDQFASSLPTLNDADASQYVQMSKDPNVTVGEINAFLGKRAMSLPPGAENMLTQYRQALAKGASPTDTIDYVSAAHNILGPEPDKQTREDFRDPNQSDTGAALEEGMAYNPMNIISNLYKDWTNAPVGNQNFTKEALQKAYPYLDDNAIETLHDSLIGELERRAEGGASAEVTDRGVNPALRMAGNFAGGLSPADLAPLGRGAKFGARLAEGVGYNEALDAAQQVHNIEYGVQDEYNPERSVDAAVTGAIFQGAAESVMHGVGGATRAISSKLPTRDAAGAPIAPVDITVPTSRKNSKKYKEQLTQTRQEMADHINSVTGKWKNSPEFEVHEDFSKMDGIDNDAIGAVTPDGKVVLNSKRILEASKVSKATPKEIINAVVYHEALGHHGLAQKFGDQLSTVLTNFYEKGVHTFREDVDKFIAENPDYYDKNDPNYMSNMIEEVLAKKSEAGAIPVTLKDKISNIVKMYARKMGIGLKYSDREIETILGMAHDATINGKRMDVAGNGFKFMNIGERAHNNFRDRLNLRKAKKLDEDNSEMPWTIHDETGWWKDKDGGWRQRLGDNTSELKTNPETGDLAVHDLTDSHSPVAMLDGQQMDKRRIFKRLQKHDEKYKQEMDDTDRNGNELTGYGSRAKTVISSLVNTIKDTGKIPTKKEWLDNSRWLKNRTESDASLWHEIADDVYDVVSKQDISFKHPLKLSDILDHRKLFDKYPWLKDIPVAHKDGYLGAMHPPTKMFPRGRMALDIPKMYDQGYDIHGVILHEIQHAIQDHEGWARGGNPGSALDQVLAKHEILPAAEKLAAKREKSLNNLDEQWDVLNQVWSQPIIKKWRRAVDALKELEKSHGKQSHEYAKDLYETEKIREEARKEIGSDDAWHFIAEHVIFGEHPHRQLSKLAAKASQLQYRLHDLKKAIDNYDLDELTSWIKNDPEISYEGYHWLMGEAEARDTQSYRLWSTKDLNRLGPGVGKAEHLDPDYLRVDLDHTGFSDSAQTGSNKYMRDYTPEDQAAVESAKETIEGALDHYHPTYRSWAEGKRAARERGLTAKQIRKAKSVGELDKKLFQYDAAAQKADEQLAELHAKMDSGNFTMKDKARYLEAVYTFNEATSRIFDDHAEIARALNAMKAITYSKNKLGKFNELLAEFDHDMVSGFANEANFKDFADQVKYLMDTQNANGAHTMMRATSKPYWWEYLLSFRHAMMLLGLGTHAKNAMDNGLMLARELEESVMAMPGFAVRKGLQATGMHVKDGVSPQEVAARLYGILRATLDATTYKDTVSAFMRGHPNRAINPKIELADARIPVVSKVSDALYAADTFFRSFHNNANLYSLGVRRAREEGFKGMAAFENGTNYAVQPSEKMRKDAKQLTDTALLVDTPSGFSAALESVKSIRPHMRPGEQAKAFAANLLFPFFRVTDRLLFQQLRRSPLAFLDKNTRKEFAEGGAKRDIAIARALFGSTLIWYYWNQAGKGNVVGNGPQDYKKLQALQAGGYKQNAVNEGDKYTDATALNLSLTPGDLHNAVASNVASLRTAWDEAVKNKDNLSMKTIAEGVGNTTVALLTVLSSSSFADNISMYMEPFRANGQMDRDVAISTLVGTQADQWIPAALRQYNQSIHDPVKRDSTGDGSISDRIKGRLQQDIPGLSDKLPAKYDNYGDQMQQGRSISGMRNYQSVKQDEVSKELQNLERTTDKVVVSGAPSSIKVNGDSIRLKAEDKQEWQRVQGFYLRYMMKGSLASGEWKQASKEERIGIVKDMHKEAYDATKEYMLPRLGAASTDGEDDNGE